MNPRINNRICYMVEMVARKRGSRAQNFALGASSSVSGSFSGTDALTNAAGLVNPPLTGLPRTQPVSVPLSAKPSCLFVCALGEVPCQELMCV